MFHLQEHIFCKEDIRPCHTDINPYNLIGGDAELKLVDWGAATQESYYFDLASVCLFFYFYSTEKEQLFLERYFTRPLRDQESRKLQLMKFVVSVYYGLMFLLPSVSKSSTQELLLEQECIDALPDYPSFMAEIGQGNINLSCQRSQQKMSFSYFKMANEFYRQIKGP